MSCTMRSFGVVAARDLNAAFTQSAGGEIQLRCGHHADIQHLYACLHQALYQRLRQVGTTQATITAHRDLLLAKGQGLRAKTAAQGDCHVGMQCNRYHATYVIRFENGRLNHHPRHCRGRILRIPVSDTCETSTYPFS